MAVLTAADYKGLRKALYRPGEGKDELKARPALPPEAQLLAAFQAIEDWWTTNNATLKTQIDVAIGFTTTVPLARKIGKAWLQWKWGLGG